jgi:hypothetical protein
VGIRKGPLLPSTRAAGDAVAHIDYAPIAPESQAAWLANMPSDEEAGWGADTSNKHIREEVEAACLASGLPPPPSGSLRLLTGCCGHRGRPRSKQLEERQKQCHGPSPSWRCRTTDQPRRLPGHAPEPEGRPARQGRASARPARPPHGKRYDNQPPGGPRRMDWPRSKPVRRLGRPGGPPR